MPRCIRSAGADVREALPPADPVDLNPPLKVSDPHLIGGFSLPVTASSFRQFPTKGMQNGFRFQTGLSCRL